jgi:serine/threonine-protein kinase
MRAGEAERWPRIEAMLDAAMQVAPADRPALLDRLCAGDLGLRQEVESLLGATPAHDFLEHSASSFAIPYVAEIPAWSPGEGPGAVVGRYRLVQEIGRGGMGTVWLAERADGQFEQRVALKLIKRGMDTDEILARFLRERQILARLEHPNIARLLDGGVSEDGRPYFVMEHVAGVPITRYCDERRLSLEERLRLFVSVCRAVQNAHQNLVVHRDIKPSNVLVSGAGDIKLLDFGVARLLGETGDADTRRGGGEAHLITPEYASPEQAAGKPVATTSDVYQLGVLLSELMTGRRPVGGRLPSTRVERREEQPRRDGTVDVLEPAAIAARRRVRPDELRRKIRGDLDLIMQRALRDEPDQRYASALAMAEDVDRHLSHRPIHAAERPWSYRAARFVRRNRFRLAAATAVVLLGVGGGAAYLTQIRAERDRARHETAKALESAALLRRFFQGWSPDNANRGEVSTGQVLGDAVRRAELELATEPEMLAATLSMLGDVHTAVGLSARAESLFVRALAIQSRGREASLDLATTLARRGTLLNRVQRSAEAEPVLRGALAMYRSLPEARPADVVMVEFELGRALLTIGRLAEAEALLRNALRGTPGDESPLASEIAAELGVALFQQARHQEASAIQRSALEQQRRLFGRLHPSTLRTTRFLAASLRDQGILEEAETLYLESLEIGRTIYGADHLETAAISGGFTVLLERQGRFAEAEEFSRHAVSNSVRLYGEENPTTARVQSTLGAIVLAQGRQAEAESILRRALATLQRTSSSDDLDQGDMLNRLAHIALTRKAPDAERLYRAAVAFEQSRKPDGPMFGTDGYEYLGGAALLMGDRALAERMFRRALTLYEKQLPVGHLYRIQAAEGLRRTLQGGR